MLIGSSSSLRLDHNNVFGSVYMDHLALLGVKAKSVFKRIKGGRIKTSISYKTLVIIVKKWNLGQFSEVGTFQFLGIGLRKVIRFS